jgi:hypothetical protein
MKIEGSGSGSTSQRHGSPDPDPHQNVMDPEHCPEGLLPGPEDGGGGHHGLPPAARRHCQATLPAAVRQPQRMLRGAGPSQPAQQHCETGADISFYG